MAEIKEWKYNQNTSIPTDVLNYIPEDSARYYKIVPVELEDGKLVIVSTDPESIDVKDAVNFIASHENIEYEIRQANPADFEKVLQQYGDAAAAVSDVVSSLELEEEDEVKTDVFSDDNDEDLSEKDSAPLIKFVNSILGQAVKEKASDIHIEPIKDKSIVRFRVDGGMRVIIDVPKKGHRPLIARIKILCNIRLDERRKPQDGRFSAIFKGKRVDFRVVTMPTVFGEKAVLRVLDSTEGIKDLGELGITGYEKEKLLSAIKKPYGMILVTGPTGSGKTTTLYSLLNLLDRQSKNIVSLEDPVEYELEGINQSSIRPEIDFTFATGLRSILRADPDVILVGEIRDKETAQLAIQAAFTGHLVFSTLHTNTSVGAIARLIDIGIEPFFLSPTLNLILGQRLVKKFEGEPTPEKISPELKAKINEQFNDLPEEYKSGIPEFKNFYKPTPTDVNQTGLRGRIGVYEALEINAEIEAAILKTPTEEAISKLARKNGMMTMYEDALIKASQGLIPFTEVAEIKSADVLEEFESQISSKNKDDVNSDRIEADEKNLSEDSEFDKDYGL